LASTAVVDDDGVDDDGVDDDGAGVDDVDGVDDDGAGVDGGADATTTVAAAFTFSNVGIILIGSITGELIILTFIIYITWRTLSSDKQSRYGHGGIKPSSLNTS